MADGAVNRQGMVSLVGAGPGDDGLLTAVGAERCLEWADLIVADRLALPAIERWRVRLASRGVEIIDAGKAPGGAGWTQQRIHALLIARAREGKRVVRLKGGDPFIFGRGLEEVQVLEAAGVPWEVIPGLSSVLAAPALAGIALTLRGVASAFHVLTGETGDGGDGLARWREAARLPGTLVVLMGVSGLARVTGGLIQGGMSGDTPCALIERASLPDQRVTVAPLTALAATAAQTGLAAPAVAVIGPVVAHRIPPRTERGAKPLRGWRIADASAASHRGEQSRRVEELGGLRVVTPMLVERPLDIAADRCREIETRLARCDAVLFTSPAAVCALAGLTRVEPRTAVVIGPVTAQVVRRRWGREPIVAPGSGAEGLRGLADRLRGQRLLWLRGEAVRPETRAALEEIGADVEEEVIYALDVCAWGVARLRGLLRERALKAVLWTSPRGVEAGLGALAEAERRDLAEGVVMAAIGSTTADALRRFGVEAGVTSPVPAMDDLAEALARHADPAWVRS